MDDITVFPGKTMADIFAETYDVTKAKREKIQDLIDGLTGFIKSSADALNLVPMIQGYLDVSVKNDEQLLKMATIVQRMNTGSSSGGAGVMLSEEERAQLMGEVKEVKKIEAVVEKSITEVGKLNG